MSIIKEKHGFAQRTRGKSVPLGVLSETLAHFAVKEKTGFDNAIQQLFQQVYFTLKKGVL